MADIVQILHTVAHLRETILSREVIVTSNIHETAIEIAMCTTFVFVFLDAESEDDDLHQYTTNSYFTKRNAVMT